MVGERKPKSPIWVVVVFFSFQNFQFFLVPKQKFTLFCYSIFTFVSLDIFLYINYIYCLLKLLFVVHFSHSIINHNYIFLETYFFFVVKSISWPRFKNNDIWNSDYFFPQLIFITDLLTRKSIKVSVQFKDNGLTIFKKSLGQIVALTIYN